MNQKTAMQQLIDYIDLLNSKNLPEYTLAVATRLKAIELLQEEKEQIEVSYFVGALDYTENQPDIFLDWINENSKSYYNKIYNNETNTL